MHDIPSYSPQAPERAEVDALPGLTLLQFGTDWCGHCQAAAPAVAEALQTVPAASALRHLLVEDGGEVQCLRGKPGEVKGRQAARRSGAQARVQVNFTSEGTKWLMLGYAKLEAV